MKRNIFRIFSIFTISIILIIILGKVYWHMRSSIKMMDLDSIIFDVIIIGIILFVFGLLIEHNRIIDAITKGFNINKVYFFIAIGILIVSCLPLGSISSISYGIGQALDSLVVRYLFSIWSGILMARSLKIKTLHAGVENN